MDYRKMAKYWYVLGILTLFIFTLKYLRPGIEISYMFFGISIVLPMVASSIELLGEEMV